MTTDPKAQEVIFGPYCPECGHRTAPVGMWRMAIALTVAVVWGILGWIGLMTVVRMIV